MLDASAGTPSGRSEEPDRRRATDRQDLVEDLVDAALAAMRQAALEPLVQQRPRVARWLMRHLRSTLLGTVGDALGGDGDLAVEAGLLLRWGITQLRPDQQPNFEGIGAEDWLHRTAWRPMLSVMCHARIAPVPEFPQHYRRRPEESAADNLCGLWNVDPSTFYRYVERGQRALARLCIVPPSVPRRLALRRFLAAEVARRLGWTGDRERLAWHRQQAEHQRHRGDPVSALWHAVQAADVGLALSLLAQHAAVVASDAEADALVERIAALGLTRRQQFDLWLARATLARTRQAPEREESCCRQALQLAEAEGDDEWRGIALGALGRCFESRDAERAFTYYEDSLARLRATGRASSAPESRGAYLNTLARVALMYVRRNHPGARELLDEGAALVQQGAPDDVAGMLEQVWAEYWRVSGAPDRALQCRLRALAIFERIGDRRSVLATYRNLMVVYADAGDIDRVESCSRVIFDEASRRSVEPGILLGAHGNLGYAYGSIGRYDRAIEHYRLALDLAVAARHEDFANRARHNLANAYYRRFLETEDPAYERLGDELVAALVNAPASTVTQALLEEARGLKASVLGRGPERSIDQLLDDESAAHLPEMSEIKRQRQTLATATDEATRVEARLAIARAYATIAAKEREAARALIEREGLQDRFRGEFDELRQTFEREHTREAQLSATWKQAAADVLDDTRRAALIEFLLRDGAINKSRYGELASVAPATASKHLVTLAERGLLVQRGKGPSTRYELPGPG